MRKLITNPSVIFQTQETKICITVMFMLFFIVATFHVTVFCDAPEYLPPRRKLGEISLDWRDNPVGILKFYSAYNKPIIIREKPDKDSKKLLSCLKIADCGFDFIAVSGYIHDIKDLFKFLDPERPYFVSVELVVTEQKGNWYRFVYHTEWGKEGWAYFSSVNGDDYNNRNRIEFTPIEDLFKDAMAVYFLNDREGVIEYLELKAKPSEDAKTVTKVRINENLYLIGKNRIKDNWVKVQMNRYGECIPNKFNLELWGNPLGYSVDKLPDCPWGWVRWRKSDGTLLMWTFWEDTC